MTDKKCICVYVPWTPALIGAVRIPVPAPRQVLVTDALSGTEGYVDAGWVETHVPKVTPRDVDRRGET